MIDPQTIILRRDDMATEHGILGHLYVPEEREGSQFILRKFSTLELPWLENAKSVSAIPLGSYKLGQRRVGRRFFEKYRARFGHTFVPEIMHVPNRSAVLLHIGNTTNDSRGCVLVGYPNKSVKIAEPFIANSTQAYKIVWQLLDDLFAKYGELTIDIEVKKDE